MAVQLQRPEPSIAILRLDRPAKRNALDSAALAELLERLAELGADPELAALVLSTTDTTALCAGADVAEELDHEGGVARMEAFARLYGAIEDFPAAVVTVCVGDVLGAGAELAAGSDLRVAGDNLRLGWVGARLGVPVGPARLVPLVGLARATELILTARLLGAEEALGLDLVHAVAPEAEAEAAALDLARRVARHGAAHVRVARRGLRAAAGTGRLVNEENLGLVAWQSEGAGLPRRRG